MLPSGGDPYGVSGHGGSDYDRRSSVQFNTLQQRHPGGWDASVHGNGAYSDGQWASQGDASIHSAAYGRQPFRAATLVGPGAFGPAVSAQQQWRSVAEESIRRARREHLAALAAAEAEEDVDAESPAGSVSALRVLWRGVRRVLYLINNGLASLSVQVGLLVLFGAFIGCAGGVLVQYVRNREYSSYADLAAADQDSVYNAYPYIQQYTTYTNAIWVAIQLLLDPGMGIMPDKPQALPYRIVAQSFIGIGILYLAVIIGLVVDAVREKMAALKKGLSPVIERGHSVILGWEQSTLKIVQELALANESEGGGVVVIMAERDKEDMEKELETFISEAELRGTVVVFRSGSRLRVSDLRFVSCETARSVVAVSSMSLGPDAADAEMLHVGLNLSVLDLDPDARVVLEVRDVDAEALVKLVGGDQAFTVPSHDIIGRLMLLFVRQPGLARVYSSILGFEGSEFYVAQWHQLDDTRWRDVAVHFAGAVPIGIRTAGDNRIELNPHPDRVFQPGDALVVLAEDNDTYTWEEAVDIGPQRQFLATAPPPAVPEEMLMAGWRRDLAYLILVLDKQLAPGSVIHILCPLRVTERRRQFATNGFDEARDLVNARVVHHVGNSALKRHLSKLPLPAITSVMVLSDDTVSEKDVVYSDSHALATLMLIRSLPFGVAATAVVGGGGAGAQPYGGAPSAARQLQVVVEILDPRTQKTVSEAVDIWSASDFIQSNELISKMLAMISEEGAVKDILDELLGKKSHKVGLIPAADLVGAHQEASFWELSRECCLNHGATLIGYIEPPPTPLGTKGSSAAGGGEVAPPSCVVNPPDKGVRRSWFDFQLVVISETHAAQSQGMLAGMQAQMAGIMGGGYTQGGGGGGVPIRALSSSHLMVSGMQQQPY